MCSRPVGRIPLKTRLFFASGPVANLFSCSEAGLKPGLYKLTKSQGSRMLWLIQTNFPSAGYLHFRNRAPSRFFHFGELHTHFAEWGHFRFQVVAHEIEFMRAILSGRVECGLPRWQREDQPAMTCIHGLEPENVPEEGAVRFCIFAVNNDVSAGNHLPLLRNASRITLFFFVAQPILAVLFI